MAIRLSFHGASGTVTGSKFLIETDKEKILVDCGIFQGNKFWRLLNWDEPSFDIDSLSAIVLTHAHIDHSGYLPLVVRRGFKGPIYCTPATADLLNLLLPDAAHLQEEEARYANKHGTSKHKPAKPLFGYRDARDALKLIRTIPRDETTKLFDNIHVTPTCAGHILGSVALSFDIGGRRINFSGDVGRYDTPLLPDPQPMDLGDVLVCESTYGDRVHKTSDVLTELENAVKKSYDKKGALIIPSFAIGRTQNLLYYLSQLEREGRIPTIPVYVDSPMAVDATSIYRRYKHDYDEEASKIIESGDLPLLTENTIFCKSTNESKRINSLDRQRIIISASGMVTGGRILHHMRNLLPKESTTVLFVGYQAEGTRGRTVQSGAEDVKIFGEKIPIRAEVESISGLSAHGDKDELHRWLKSCSGSPGRVKIVHGEPDSSSTFSEGLRSEFSWESSPAAYLETIEV